MWPEGKIRVGEAVRLALQTIVRNPIVLLAIVPLLAWMVMATIFDMPGGLYDTSSGDPDARFFLLDAPAFLVVETVKTGLVTLLVYGAVEGSPSVTNALRVLGRRLPRLLALAGLIAAPPVAILIVAEKAAAPMFLLFPVALYFVFRLVFAFPAVLIDDAGVVDAVRRSWRVTYGNVWRTIALGAAFVPLRMSRHFLDEPAAMLCELLAGTAHDAVLVIAYLQRRPELPPIHASADALGPAAAPST